MLLHEYLARSAGTCPEKVALVCGGVRKSYREVKEESSFFASYLLSNGLKRGDRVGVYMDNSIDVVVAIFGILEAGGCIVVTNPSTPVDRLVQIFENCSPKFLVHSEEKAKTVLQVVRQLVQKPSLLLAGAASVDPTVQDFAAACSS